MPKAALRKPKPDHRQSTPETAAVLTVTIDPKTLTVLDCNDAAVRFYGRSRAALLACTYQDLLDTGSMLDGAGREDEAFEHPVFERHRGGDRKRGVRFLRVASLVTHSGQPARLITLIDSSIGAKAHATTLRRLAFLEQVIETLPSAIFVKDLDDAGRYVLCTRTSAEMAHSDQSAIVGRTDSELFSPQVTEAFALSDVEVVKSDGPVTSESTFCSDTGALVITETKKLPLRAADGRIRYVLGVTEDISARREMEMRLARVALQDTLTGLPNRVLFRERLRAALAKRAEAGGFVILHCIDLDHFKGVNDTLGHAAGDALLREVAVRLEAACRAGDTVARLGGDEFAVVQGPVATTEEAADLAARIGRSLGEPFTLEGRTLVVGASAGLSVSPTHGDDTDTMLRHADLALYGAKEGGRGAYRFFDAALAERAQRRNLLAAALREALAQDEFELFYQPIVDIAERRIVSFEALLRWRHPTRGFVSPAEFIPIAEETGIIVQLGEWVLKQACRQAAAWPASVGVAVNLSSIQFQHPGLALSVLHALSLSGLAPERLELEITESVLLTNNEANLDTLHQLRAIGIRISLDDFGTGYSSLSYLGAFPFTKIKIDRSFIQNLGSGPNSVAIVRSVIRLAEDLGMTATAEGVETLDQLDRLRREGCTQAQGFLFDRPRPAANLLTSTEVFDRPAMVAA